MIMADTTQIHTRPIEHTFLAVMK